jgi:hypothetical protein
MTNHQLHGRIGASTTGTNPTTTKEKQMTEERNRFGFPNKQAEVLEVIKTLEGVDYSEETGMDKVKGLALSIYDSVDKFRDGIEPTVEQVAEFTLAMHNNMSLRDFIMGLPEERDIDYVGEWVAFMGAVTPKEYAAPIVTIFAALLYENEQPAEAQYHLNYAQELDPSYSLAQLLNRVFASNWPAEQFTKMRVQLHPKVKEAIGI